MGDWRRVQIEGSCKDSRALNRHLDMSDIDADYDRFGCLSHTGGICGLPKWAAPQISASGNLAERGYDPEDVRDHLIALAKVDPSLSVKVHVGSANEGDDVEATVVMAGGCAVVGPPEVPTLPPVDHSQMQSNLMSALMGRR